MKPYYFSLWFIAIFLFSCSKDTDTLSPDPLNPGQETFKTSLFIEVFNTNGQPMANTLIQIGNEKGNTNQDGFLFLHDVVVGKSSYLTAEKEGYFHGSRRFYPTEGNSQYIRIILLSDTRDAFFTASEGGVLPVEGGVTLHFPKSGYEYENGDPYNGIVVVSVEAIPADDPDLSFKMPGDLVGIQEDKATVSLASLGMVVVKLKSNEGESIQLRPEAEVEMRMTIPVSILDSAPSSIPTWYFDEQVGVWKEEGLAVLSGDQYIAQVKHFSYWNYDAWFPIVKWGATFNYEDGSPAAHLQVCITIDALKTSKCEYTNANGVVCGMVAANELLLMEVKSDCGGIIYSQQVGPYLDTTMIGPVSIPYGNIIKSTVKGNTVNCAGSPVTNGYVNLSTEDNHVYVQIDEVGGSFSSSLINCSEGAVQVSVKDIGNNKVSLPVNFNFAPQINAGTIEVCKENLEFIDLQVVGFQDHFIFNFPELADYEGGLIIYVPDSSDLNKAFEIRFESQNSPGTYDSYFTEVYVTLPNGKRVYANPDQLSINITSFGPPGDFVRGTLAGIWHEIPGSGLEYPLLGSFAVLRD